MTAEQARAAWADVDSEITKYNARCGRTFILPTEEGAYDACIADKGLPAGITHLVVEGQDTDSTCNRRRRLAVRLGSLVGGSSNFPVTAVCGLLRRL